MTKQNDMRHPDMIYPDSDFWRSQNHFGCLVIEVTSVNNIDKISIPINTHNFPVSWIWESFEVSQFWDVVMGVPRQEDSGGQNLWFRCVVQEAQQISNNSLKLVGEINHNLII